MGANQGTISQQTARNRVLVDKLALRALYSPEKLVYSVVSSCWKTICFIGFGRVQICYGLGTKIANVVMRSYIGIEGL